MTEQELRHSLSVITTNYNRPIDENIMTLWKGLFIKFDAYIFGKACLSVIASNKFFPNAAEIIDAYQRIKSESERERHEGLKAQHKLLADGQGHCYLCGNSGYCSYTVSAYDYTARCVCPHGRDLNLFSKAQINREHIPKYSEHYNEHDKACIKHGKNPFYMLNIREALGEDFPIFDADRQSIGGL